MNAQTGKWGTATAENHPAIAQQYQHYATVVFVAATISTSQVLRVLFRLLWPAMQTEFARQDDQAKQNSSTASGGGREQAA